MLVLGIESSCDDTAAAVLDKQNVLSNIINCQDTVHAKFGGVVPELASRKHLEYITQIVDKALFDAGVSLADINLIAATQGPGLIGSLLVGFSYAKALAHVQKIPLIGVDHMAGHILSVFLGPEVPQFPYIALIVSGGTSSIFFVENFYQYRLIGRTRDDAAGEAFDKVAKLLGLPYPGGKHVSTLAETGDRSFVRFPRAWLEENSYDFSFSGLKTAVLTHLKQQNEGQLQQRLHDICASFQEAIVDVLVKKTILAAKEFKVNTIVLGGGVSANTRLRSVFLEQCKKENLSFYAPSPSFCTDNAAMIAFAGFHKYSHYGASREDEEVYSRSLLG